MAGVTLGFLRYVLGLDTIQFKKGMTAAERDLVVMQKRFDKVGQQMVGLGKNLTLGITAPLAAFAAKGISEAQETAAAMAQVNAALTSMGPVAGRTAAQLEAAANAFEGKSLFEADAILKDVSARLLGFGNIAGATFDKAQQAIVDYATRSGKDLPAATLLIGKALSDPTKAMGLLQKAGIEVTASQKALLASFNATGNVAGAQGVILEALTRATKGAAQAAQDADPWNKMKDAWNQSAEVLGKALIPLIGPLTAAIASAANAFTSLTPETQKWILIAAGAGAALGPLLIGLGGLVTVISKIGPVVMFVVKAWEVLRVAFLAARIAALATLPALIPFLVPLGAIALAVGAVYLAWKNWDKIVAVVKAVYVAVKTWVMDKLGAVFDWVGTKLKWIADKFKWLRDVVVAHSYVPDMVDGIAAQMKRLDAVMVAPVAAAVGKTAEAFRDLQQQTKGLLDRLFPEAAAFNAFKADVATLEAAMQKGILTAAQYGAALDRLRMEGLSEEPIGVLNTGSLVPDSEGIAASIEGMLDKMPQIVDRAKDFQAVMRNVATDLAQITGDWLTSFIDGSAKLKDLWKGILTYAIRALSSSSGPLSTLFGGARADGGPVMGGRAYLVGERGPEMFLPSQSGRIVANDDLRRGGGGGWSRGDVTMNIYTPDSNSFGRSQRQITRDMRRRLAI